MSEHIKRMKDEHSEVSTQITTLNGRTKSIELFFGTDYVRNILDEKQFELLEEQLGHMLNASEHLGKYIGTLSIRIDYDTEKQKELDKKYSK